MIGNKLKLLREQKQKSQQEVCDELHIEQGTLANYESDRRVPKIEILIKIASYYNVTVDFLLGLESNDASNSIFFSDNWEEYQSKLLSAIKENNLSEKEYESLVGIPYNEVPTVDDLIKISNVLSISIDYLLGVLDCDTHSNENNLVDESLSDREQDILSAFRYLDSDNKDIMVGELKKLLKEQKYESVAADAPVKEAK